MKHKQLYWFCQLAGWFGMVAIETINYTFFIVQKFVPAVVWAMVEYAVIGIIATHIFRYILLKTNYFQKTGIRLWITASVSTVFIASIIVLANFLPAMLHAFSDFAASIRIIDVVGYLMNWMRYVGVWVILYFMYKILQQNNQILHEKMSLENLAKTTELELLKTQLNPHFLFNALNSIKALVTINPEQSRDAIVKLSELLRFTLQYGREKVITVNDEITEVAKYLELEQLRFGERLNVTIEVDNETQRLSVPPAILLTLAENAVKHGVAKHQGNNVVAIHTCTSQQQLVLELRNTGHLQTGNGQGIGLQQVKKRLEEIYHNKALFTIENETAETVLATIKIPLSWQ